MALSELFAMFCGLFFIFNVCISQVKGDISETPANFTKVVGNKISKNADVFYLWGYGGALIYDGLWQANQSFGIPYGAQVNDYLDMFIRDKSQYGYKIIHNITVPFGEAVGDTIGLFPITYLNRALSYSGVKPGYDNTTDMYIVNTVAKKYILQWPRRLPDGTFSRDKGWIGEKGENASFLWGDDQYMGLTLLARLAASTKNLTLAQMTAQQVINFAKYLRDPLDGLFSHGYNHADNKRSCCKWGRANGWGMMAHAEVLKSLETFPNIKETRLYKQVLSIYQSLSKALADVQSVDGRWHQVLNETNTFLETTASAMFISSISKGVFFKWLNIDQYITVLNRGWAALSNVVRDDGTVTGCCIGTGILTSVNAYNSRPTPYLTRQNTGLGAVIYAGVDYGKVVQAYSYDLK